MLQPRRKGDSRPVWDFEKLTFNSNRQIRAGAKSYAHAMPRGKLLAVTHRRQ